MLNGKIFVNGKFKTSKGSKIAVVNPATLKGIGFITESTNSEIDNAVDIAYDAQQSWAQARHKGKILKECANVIKNAKEELAQLLSLETGKAIRTESRLEIDSAVDGFEFFAGLATELKGETIPFDPDMFSFTIQEPLGVIAAILPWNVPLMLFAMKVAPALLAGNSVVVKPAPEASLIILKCCELLQNVIPAGVLNVITGDAEAGERLITNPKISKVSFTGSVNTGKHVAKFGVPVVLELGGKSPLIIDETADIQKAVQGVYDGMRFTRAGQSCSAASRVIVHESLHDQLLTELIKLLSSKIIGDPLDEATDIGAVISQTQFQRIQNYLKLAAKDTKIQSIGTIPKDGLFIAPTIISNISPNHRISKEEIFGPVLSVFKFNKFQEALDLANDTDFGLAGGIYTKDLGRAMQAVKTLNAGFVQVNQYIVFRPSLPFGGFKDSGHGKEASLRSVVEHYMRSKTVLINTLGK